MNRHFLNSLFKLAVAAVLGTSLAACSSFADGPIQEISLPSSTPPPPSPTVIWFPPSTTPTPQHFPTQAPTPERKPGVGGTILSDDFSSPGPWNPAVSDQAGVNIEGNQLTIAAGAGQYAYRVRQGSVFTDFYAEITARPSLCRGADTYGLLFRAPNNVAYYEFALACNGTASVERLSVGVPRELQVPTPSADVPPGAPGEVRIGVWASGSDLRFFLNGRYQFSVDDRNYPSGAVGVFASSAGNTPVTVTFSDLVVRAVDYAPPTPTPLP